MFPSSFSDLSDFSERPPWLLVSGSDIGFLIVYWSVYMVFFVLSYLIFRRWNAKVWIQTLWAWWVSNIWTMKISFWDFLLFPNQSIFARIQSWSYFIRIPNKIHVLKPNSLTLKGRPIPNPKPMNLTWWPWSIPRWLSIKIVFADEFFIHLWMLVYIFSRISFKNYHNK